MSLNPHQFNLDYVPTSELPKEIKTGGEHAIVAKVGENKQPVGILAWGNPDAPSEEDENDIGAGTRGSVTWVETHPRYRRQGLATEMWKKAQEVAQSNEQIPEPEHSNTRTEQGDAWARKVGGRVPEQWGSYAEPDSVLK